MKSRVKWEKWAKYLDDYYFFRNFLQVGHSIRSTIIDLFWLRDLWKLGWYLWPFKRSVGIWNAIWSAAFFISQGRLLFKCWFRFGNLCSFQNHTICPYFVYCLHLATIEKCEMKFCFILKEKSGSTT